MSLTAVDFTLSPMLESGTSVNVQDVQDIEEKVYTILESKCQTLHDLNDPNGFIPYSDLKSIFTAEVIRHILRQNGKLQLLEHDLEEIVSCILAEDTSKVMIKIFAILVLTGMVKYIREFICNGLTDADLPMTQKPTLDERLSFWKKRKFDAFSSRQWLVDVPVLDFEIDDLETIEEYPDETRMPFLHRIPVGKGGQGKVEKVTVHPSHVVNSSDTIFAMKRMDSLLKWEDETKALNRFRDKSGHDHIIKLLLAFKYRGKGYLLFPLAEGDLDHYWKLNTSQSFSAEEVHWLIEQCTGIASALRKIHNHLSFHGERRGRHGDIKPGNILWFSNLAEGHGRLVLADLTMTRFHSDGTVEDTTIKNRAMTMTYRPPEADVNVKTKASQAFDVWSLGCVFLEYIVWYIMGYDAARHDSDEYLDSQQRVRQNFNRARVNEDGADPGSFSFDKFFKVRYDASCGRPIAEVKSSVQEWVKLLHASESCSRALHDFLDLITDRMLVIEPGERITMQQVHVELVGIFERCSNTEYYHRGYPQNVSTLGVELLYYNKSTPDIPSFVAKIPNCFCPAHEHDHDHDHEDGESHTYKIVESLFGDANEVSDAPEPDLSDAAPPKLQVISDTTSTIPGSETAGEPSNGLDLEDIRMLSDEAPTHVPLPTKLSVPAPTTLPTSYLQDSSDTSSIRRRSHSSRLSIDQSADDQDHMLRHPGGAFSESPNQTQRLSAYGSILNETRTSDSHENAGDNITDTDGQRRNTVLSIDISKNENLDIPLKRPRRLFRYLKRGKNKIRKISDSIMALYPLDRTR